MYYVTHGYTMKEFETEKQVKEYILLDMNKQGLSYQEVFNETKNDIQIIVYQYYTLYMEVYTIHKKMDLRDWRKQ